MRLTIVPPATAALALAMVALPASAGEWGGLFPSVGVTSDYRYQGVSNSDGHPAVQGNVHYWRPDGLYAGLFVSQVDFNDGSTSFETDWYAGKTWDLDRGRTRLAAEAMYTAFPDNETWGPTYDFLQLKLAARRQQGPLALTATGSYVPQASYGSGQAWRLEGGADYALNRNLTVKAQVGKRWIDRGSDRAYWSLGASLGVGGSPLWRDYVFELRFQDTDRGKRDCGYNPDICGPALVGTVTVNLKPIL
ncbi:TorF family putative porin [Phenylobacterium sp.]|uniref:TorF family putative porin n=1 Tax=Phenylobacterium sp. TaxID=1871053 RepID=UPI0035B14046